MKFDMVSTVGFRTDLQVCIVGRGSVSLGSRSGGGFSHFSQQKYALIEKPFLWMVSAVNNGNIKKAINTLIMEASPEPNCVEWRRSFVQISAKIGPKSIEGCPSVNKRTIHVHQHKCFVPFTPSQFFFVKLGLSLSLDSYKIVSYMVLLQIQGPNCFYYVLV